MHNTDTINGVYTKQRVLFSRRAVKMRTVARQIRQAGTDWYWTEVDRRDLADRVGE